MLYKLSPQVCHKPHQRHACASHLDVTLVKIANSLCVIALTQNSMTCCTSLVDIGCSNAYSVSFSNVTAAVHLFLLRVSLACQFLTCCVGIDCNNSLSNKAIQPLRPFESHPWSPLSTVYHGRHRHQHELSSSQHPHKQ